MRKSLSSTIVASTCVATMFACDEAGAERSESPTFVKDVAPLVLNHCAECHRTDGNAPFSFVTYDDVKERGRQIVEVISSGFMPPWLQDRSASDVQYFGERGLTREQIDTIRRWVEAGSPQGEVELQPAETPPQPRWRLGEPDLVVTMAQPYTAPAESRNTIRTFVLPIALPGLQVIKAIDFDPGNPRAVHHASFSIDTTGSARLLDEHDEIPGYPGMGDLGLNLAGSFGTWSPGDRPQFWPTGIGREMPKNCDLIVEMHLNPTGKPEQMQPSVAIYFERADIKHRAVSVSMGSFALDIAAGDKSYTVKDEITLPVDVKLLSIAPHAHYICKTIQITATLPDSACVRLLSISDWDFNWQQEYRLSQPKELPAGTKIQLTMTYDNSSENSRNPNVPPRRVQVGFNPEDEMALVFLTMTASDENERPEIERLQQEKLVQRMREAQAARSR